MNTSIKISVKDFNRLNSSYKEAKTRSNLQSLEAEYSCLKALFQILETEDFKYTDFDCVTFMNHYESNEIEIMSKKFNVHKILKSDDIVTYFKISPYAFIDFLHVNGAINERIPKKNNRPVGNFIHNDKIAIAPKVGEYYLCALTGFWKEATLKEIELFDNKRKETLYMNFSGLMQE